MQAMILAAGRGERMRPLTDSRPKPLLQVGGRALIAWHLRRLAAAGIRDIVINLAWLGSQIEAALGDGHAWGVRIAYSPEPHALETAAGIARVLPFFQDRPFLVVNGDVWCDWDFKQAAALADRLDAQTSAWLLLVDNPPHHPAGDFALTPEGRVALGGGHTLTFSGIGLYHPAMFNGVPVDRPAPLGPLLRNMIAEGRVAGARHEGHWVDVGTPERLRALDDWLRRTSETPADGDAPPARC